MDSWCLFCDNEKISAAHQMILDDTGKHRDFGGFGDQLEILWFLRATLRHPKVLATRLVDDELVADIVYTTIPASLTLIQEVRRPSWGVLSLR